MQRVVVIAALAFGYPATVVAQQRGRKAAAVKKQQHLVIRLQMLTHALDQRRRKTALQLNAFEIDQLLRRLASVAGAFAQVELTILAALYVMQRFQRRRG